MDRRGFLGLGLGLGAGAVLAVPSLARVAGAKVVVDDGQYGPLLAPDANGLMLPAGFTSRVIAVSGEAVVGTGYRWHTFPDGGAVFPEPGGEGWAYVSNSEVPKPDGGVGVLRFDRDGKIVEAERLLVGTDRNCAGGATPWGTWLSCEEVEGGLVWEVDPYDATNAGKRPSLGAFIHEAVAVDPERGQLYLTEDAPDGRFYRFTPDAYPDLSSGRLEVMASDTAGANSWVAVPDPSAGSQPTREQVPESRAFSGGEGIWFDGDRTVYLTTKGDDTVWAYGTADEGLAVIYTPTVVPKPPILTGVDNIVGTPNGDLLVAEDTGANELDLVLLSPPSVSPLVRVVAHEGSELTGPAFSPDGSHLYFSSQRGRTDDGGGTTGGGAGITFEVTGPFRSDATPATTTAATGATSSTTIAPSGSDDGFPVPVALGGAAALAVAGAAGAIWLRSRRAT